MKICATQAMMAIIVCGASIAHDNYAQLLDTKVTLSLREVPLEVALKKLESATGVKMFYSIDQLHLYEKVSIEAEGQTLRAVLDALLTTYNIRYKVNERKGAVILKRQTEAGPGDQGSLNELPQSRDTHVPFVITGRVSDAATQQPMAGVNIVVKGTTVGTTTDADGKYSIEADDGDILVFSFIGYTALELVVNSRSVIDVSLEEDVKSLGEVVINAGYWQVTDTERTGNITKIEAKEIRKQPVQNPLAALQGRVAGLEVIQSTGVPGGNFTVRIRGTNSIANGNDPLFIVDGVPYTSRTMSFNETSRGILGNFLGASPLNNINPSDIESIEVLKDADATAIYGSRGSGGVILVTTKKGQVGKTKVDVNFYSGAGRVSTKFDQLDTRQYIDMRKEAFANDGTVPTISNARDLLEWDTTRYTDWQKELLGGTALTSDGQISISGGEKYTQFSVGVGYHRETTVFPGANSDQRVSSHTSITTSTPNGKFRSFVTLNYSVNSSDLLSQDLTSAALLLPPNAPALYDETGNLNWDGWSTSGSLENPVAYTKRMYEANTNALVGSLEVGYSIIPNLEIKSRFGYTNNGMKAVRMIPLSSLAPSVSSMSLNETHFSNSAFQNWMVEPQLNWTPKLGRGEFAVLIGSQFLDQTTEGLAQKATGFTSEALMQNITAGPNRTFGSNYYSQYRYHAIFGRVNFNYDSRYIINITGRRDGSSRFGPGRQFANFGALGVGWIFSNENFIKNAVPFLSYGKLRGSYGITGNDQLTDYQYLDSYTSSPYPYQGTLGLTPERLSNPDFAWETNKKLEVAVEVGFAEDRVVTSASLYRNRSSNQLVGYPLPPTAGFNSIQANFPALVQNTGVEIEINTVNLRFNGFRWATGLNVSVPRNKLVKFPNLASTPAYVNRYVVGEPLSIAKLYSHTGVDPLTGIYQFQDVNEDGNFDNADRQSIRFIGAELFGGLNNSFSYKGFQLDVLFQFTKQSSRNILNVKSAPGQTYSNQPESVEQRWQNPGDIADTQRFGRTSVTTFPYALFTNSDKVVSDASFIRLKNLSISYTLPVQWISKAGASNARIFMHGQNLVTISKYEGLDPETGNSFLPPLRVLTGGFSLTF